MTTLLPFPTAPPPILWLEDAAAADLAGASGEAAAPANGIDDHDGFVVPGRLYPGVVEQAYRRLGERAGEAEPLVAVHRATADEHADDGGQHDTMLAVRGAEDLLEAIRSCRASAQDRRPLERRRPDGRASVPAPPPVFVELLTAADAAAQPALVRAAA